MTTPTFGPFGTYTAVTTGTTTSYRTAFNANLNSFAGLIGYSIGTSGAYAITDLIVPNSVTGGRSLAEPGFDQITPEYRAKLATEIRGMIIAIATST